MTAEEILNDIRFVTYSEEEKLITFAKYHVEQALKAASKKAEITVLKKNPYSNKPRWKAVSKKEAEEGVDLFTYDVQSKVSKKSILNAYPLGNIK